MKNIIKKIAILIAFVGLMQNSIAQVRVYPTFNSITSGRSINLLASTQVKNRHELGGGLRVNININDVNKYVHSEWFDYSFKKQMFATKPLHYFGIEGFYQIHLFPKLQCIDFFAFYDIQLVYSTAGNTIDKVELNPKTGSMDYKYFLHLGPFTWIEQNIGIGFTVDIWKNIFFTQRFGGGTCIVLGKDNYLGNEPSCEFGYMLSVGIGYRFEPRPSEFAIRR